MQCNTWCADLLFQKVKNYLGLTEREHDLYWLYAKFNFGFMQIFLVHDYFLMKN